MAKQFTFAHTAAGRYPRRWFGFVLARPAWIPAFAGMSVVLITGCTQSSPNEIKRIKCAFVDSPNVTYAFEVNLNSESAILLSDSDLKIETDIQPSAFKFEMKNNDSQTVNFFINRIDGFGYVEIDDPEKDEFRDNVKCEELKELKF